MPLSVAARGLAGAALTGAAAACLVASPAGAMTAESQTFLTRTNAVRAFWHEAPVQENATLDAKATWWANTMAATHTLMHSSLTAGVGAQPWTMLGENVGVQPMPNANPDLAIFNTFVGSATHFDNMVNAGFTQMGVAVARSADGTVWVAEEFGRLG